MPWEETNPEMQRLMFIHALAESSESMAELCRRFGISRQTGYLWKRRFEEGGPSALVDRPSYARTHPNGIDVVVADRIVEIRKAHPTWGPKKIRAILKEELDEVPAASTVGDVLKRRGQIAAKRRRVRVPPQKSPLTEYNGPNSVWCIDHKGDFALDARTRCYPLTMMDGHSRYLLKLEALLSTSEQDARPHIELAFREYGLPVCIRSDSGTPFATSSAPGRLSSLAVWWVKLGIRPERIAPGHPEQNGRLERFHLTLEEAIPKVDRTLAEQQRLFDGHRGEYNHVRPHEALEQRVPASAYESSWRSYPAVVGSPEYANDEDVRRVNAKGVVKWRSHEVRLTRLLAGEPVFFTDVGDEQWEIWFGPVFLATATLREEKIRLSYERAHSTQTPTTDDGESRTVQSRVSAG